MRLMVAALSISSEASVLPCNTDGVLLLGPVKLSQALGRGSKRNGKRRVAGLGWMTLSLASWSVIVDGTRLPLFLVGIGVVPCLRGCTGVCCTTRNAVGEGCFKFIRRFGSRSPLAAEFGAEYESLWIVKYPRGC